MTTTGGWTRGARAVFDAGEFARCVGLCREGLTRRPDDGELWQLCGTACWELGLLDEAQEALETAFRDAGDGGRLAAWAARLDRMG